MLFYVQQDERGGARSSECTHTHVHHTLISLSWPGRRVHHTTCSTQTLFMHTKCIHAHKPNEPEENKKTNQKKRYKTHGIMTVLTILPYPHISRHRGYNHHGNSPRHLASHPHTSRHRGYSHHLVSPTHFTPQRLQSPSCLTHTLHGTEATVTILSHPHTSRHRSYSHHGRRPTTNTMPTLGNTANP